MTDSPELNGLVLIGGKSKRMGRDKAGIELAPGETMQDRAVALLERLGLATFLSVAADDARAHPVPVIRDLEADLGPLGAIHSALATHPDKAWLVLACDMPNLDEESLRLLVSERDPAAEATCFLNPADQHPEPLCTIYEPSSLPQVARAIRDRRLCARKLLGSLSRHDLPPTHHRLLDNCNRPEHLAEVQRQQEQPATAKTVSVEYFASLRDPAGTGIEQVTTRAHTAAGLWDELRLRHGFHLDLDAVRLARNDEFADWTTELREGDRLAFLPPFAGG